MNLSPFNSQQLNKKFLEKRPNSGSPNEICSNLANVFFLNVVLALDVAFPSSC